MNKTKLALIAAAVAVGVVAVPTASAQATCAGLGGTVDGNQVCHVHNASAGYTLDMSVPLDYPDQQAVLDYLTKDRADFLNWLAKFGGNGPGRTYMHDVSAKTYRSSGTQSLVLEIDDDTGAAHEDHPNTWYQAFNYDLGKQAPITFETLFKPGSNPLEVLNPIVQSQLGRQSGIPVHDLDASAYRNFAMADDAVIFFFGEDQVVSDNAGPQEVSVPRSVLTSLLNQEFR